MISSRANMRVLALTGDLFEGAAVPQSQRLRSVAPLLGLIVALRLHLPFGPEAFWVLLALSDETR
jgi:hypothetical protein